MSKHHAISRSRWNQTQQSALDFWKNRNLADERKASEAKYLELLKPFTERLDSDANILEIGCGALCLTQALPQKNKTFLDPLIDDFRRMFPGELSDGEYISGTAENILYQDRSFDLIICLNTISFSLNPELIMNEIKRLLRDDGLLLLSIRTHSGLEARLHYLAERWFPWLCRGSCPYFYSLQGIRNTLERHFSIQDDIIVDEQHSWLPVLKRQEHLFACSRKDAVQATTEHASPISPVS